MEKPPVYNIGIDEADEATGVKVVSFVSDPAIEEGFLALSKQEKAFNFADDVRQVITGPALVPDKEILRLADDGSPYYIVFSTDVIEHISIKFLKEQHLSATNIEHTGTLSSNFVIESWIIKDSNKDKAAALGFELPAGTWMLSYKIPDREQYDEIKENATGFSIEGRFILDQKFKKVKKMNKSLFEKVIDTLKPLFLADEGEATQKPEEKKQELGPNLARVLSEGIAAWEVEDAKQATADAAGISMEDLEAVLNGSVACPLAATVLAIANSVPTITVDEAEGAWLADGCGEEEQKKEEAPATPAPVEQKKEDAPALSAELATLKSSLDILNATIEQLKADSLEKDAEIAEMKKQPAAKPVNTAPVEAAKVQANDKKQPFHARYIQTLKKLR